MRPSCLVVEHQNRLVQVFCDWLVETLRDSIEQRGMASVALPGGSVAEALWPSLAKISVDWSKVHVFWGDERSVPPDSAESNYALAKRLLLAPAEIPDAMVHRMPAEREPMSNAVQEYSAVLVRELGDPPAIDVVILGLGPDGHVCSLFPNHAALTDPGWVTSVSDAPKPPPRRITLTLGTLACARHVALVALGSTKSAIVRRVLEDDPTHTLPATRALADAAHSLVFLDLEAASSLVNPRQDA